MRSLKIGLLAVTALLYGTQLSRAQDAMSSPHSGTSTDSASGMAAPSASKDKMAAPENGMASSGMAKSDTAMSKDKPDAMGHDSMKKPSDGQ